MGMFVGDNGGNDGFSIHSSENGTDHRIGFEWNPCPDCGCRDGNHASECEWCKAQKGREG